MASFNAVVATLAGVERLSIVEHRKHRGADEVGRGPDTGHVGRRIAIFYRYALLSLSDSRPAKVHGAADGRKLNRLHANAATDTPRAEIEGRLVLNGSVGTKTVEA